MTETGDESSCAGCFGPGLVKFGTRSVLRASIGADGRLVRESVAVQRYRCKDCGRASVDALDDAEIVEGIGDCAIRLGVTAAAARLGIDPGTVSRTLARWIESRRDEADVVVPDVVALSSVRSGQPLRLMVSDPHEDGLIEIVDGIEGLRALAGASDSTPSLVSVEVDAAVTCAVRNIWPTAVVAVPSAAALRAASAAALSSFRALVRAGVAQGRNFRERPHLLRVSNADLTDDQREEISAPLKNYRSAVLLLLGALRSADPAGFVDVLARVLAALREVAQGGALESFLTTWRAEIANGVGNRWLDRAWIAVDALRREVAAVRPSAGLDVLRAILVFSVPRSALPVLAPAYGYATPMRAGPRPITGAMDALLSLTDAVSQ